MNRWKMKAAALLCALSVMPAAMPQGADAAEWINLSSWSYAEVSGFVSEGLLPESLGGISDYTRPIKRWEFCELIYSVLDKTGMFKDDRYKLSFADCDDHQNVNKLYSAYIVNGVESENGTFFYPENDITREDAAVVIENMLTRMGASLLYDISDNIYDELEKRIYDAEKVSEYAQRGGHSAARKQPYVRHRKRVF